MNAIDYVDEITGSFRKQRLRTALTTIGIGIGAFTITLMVGLGQGLQTYIETQLISFSNDRVLMVFPSAAKIGGRILDRLAGVLDDVAGTTGRADPPDHGERDVLGGDAGADLSVDPDQHGPGFLQHQRLRRQRVLDLRGADAEG